MAKCGTTKLYHILPRYLRTEAICLSVVVAGDHEQAPVHLKHKDIIFYL